MLHASVSCWLHLFLPHLRCRSLWIICETDERWIPLPCVKFLWLFYGVWGLSSWLSNSDLTVLTFSSVRSLHCLLLPGRLSPVRNFTSNLLMLFFVQPLFRNSLKSIVTFTFFQIQSSKFLSSLLNSVKVGSFAWYSVKIRVILVSGLKDEKLIKSKPAWKMKHTKWYGLYYSLWIFLPNIIEIDLYNVELYRFKVGSFLSHSVDTCWSRDHVVYCNSCWCCFY